MERRLRVLVVMDFGRARGPGFRFCLGSQRWDDSVGLALHQTGFHHPQSLAGGGSRWAPPEPYPAHSTRLTSDPSLAWRVFGLGAARANPRISHQAVCPETMKGAHL